MAKFYTGVGSRKCPASIQKIITAFARKLAGLGYTLRSGGAIGADKAFEVGATEKVVYLANDSRNKDLVAEKIARDLHPAWNRCSDYARKLHTRNAFQVLGDDLKSPSKFLVCWTPDGCKSHSTRSIKTGGTGTAISIASTRGVPIFNLAVQRDLDRVIKFIGKKQ